MLLCIVHHEFRDILRDGRFRASAFVVLGLLVTSLLTGWSYQRAVAAEHDSAADISRETWLAQSAKDPHSAAHYGAYVFKPRGPLTLVDNGVNAYTGVAAWLEAHKQNEFQFRPAQDRASVARLGQLTAAATLQMLVPLLIVLLAFTKFAGEREDGTLRQILASGINPISLAAGKAIGVAAALAVVLAPAIAVGSAALLWTSGATALSREMARAGGLAVVYAVYLAVFVALALAVSAASRRASHALALLIAFWAANGILAPRLAADVSRTLHPTPTAFEFQQRVQRDLYEGLPVHEYNLRRAADLRARLLSQYNVTDVDALPVNFRGIDYLEREAHSDDVWSRHFAQLWTAFEAQTRVHHLVGTVAPFLSVRALSMALTGGDFFHHQHFAVAAESYRREMVLAMNRDLAYGGNSRRQGAYSADPERWATVKPFNYDSPSVGWALEHVRVPLIALSGWLFGAILVLAVSLRRMTVE
jgi:ABC-2 type transport system permease protein